MEIQDKELVPLVPGAAPIEPVGPEDVRWADDGEDEAPRDRGGRRLAGRVAIRLVSLLLLLGVWWLIVALKVWPELFVPKPTSVWDRFVDSVSTHDGQKGLMGYYLWEHLWASLKRILEGIGLAIVFGTVLGLLLGTSRWFQTIAGPYVNFIRALPPLAYFSLLIIWFGIEDNAKVWLLFLAGFAPIALSVASGVRGIRPERIDAARALGAGRWQLVRYVQLPSVLPEFFTGLRLALGFAWTTIVAAETINGIPGIGGLAWSTQKFQQTDVAFLCIIVIGITAILLDQIVQAIERLTVPWRGRA
jgi:taurine transport system permease protein